MALDEYGVPLVIFGVHHPDFFPLLGRVVALAAVIERDVRTLARRLGVTQGTLNSASIAKVLKAAMGLSAGLDPDGSALRSYLTRSNVAFKRRNEYAHGLWPAASLEAGDSVVGWKQEPWSGELRLSSDLAELRTDVREFADIVMTWNDQVIHIFNRMPMPQEEDRR